MEAALPPLARDDTVLVGKSKLLAKVVKAVRDGDQTVLVRWESTKKEQEVAIDNVEKLDFDAKPKRQTRGKRSEASGSEAAAPARREPPRKRSRKEAAKPAASVDAEAALRAELEELKAEHKSLKEKKLGEEIEQHVRKLESAVLAADADDQDLIAGDPGVVAATEALAKLAHNSDATRGTVVEALVAVLMGRDRGYRSREAAARALSHVPGGDVAAVKLLIAALTNGDNSSKATAAEAVAFFVGDDASFDIARCSAIAKAGGVNLLVPLLNDREEVVPALRNLARDPATGAAIVNAGGVKVLLSTVQNGACGVDISAAEALARLADSERNAAMIIEAGAIETLSKAASSSFISNIAGGKEITKALASIIDAGGVPPLVARLMNEYSVKRKAALKALSHLPGSDDAVAEALVAALRHGDDMKKNAAARAVADFAFDANGGDALSEIPRCSAIVEADGIAPLVALLTKRNCQVGAARALANLADDSAARAKIVSIGAIKSLVSVIDASNEGVDEAGGDEVTNAARKCFELIDKKGEGFLSTAEIFTAVKTDEDVIRFLRNCGEENLQILLQPTRLKKSLDEYGFWGMDWNDWVQEIQQGVLKLAEEHALASLYAAAALAGLAVSDENKAAIIEAGAIESLSTKAKDLRLSLSWDERQDGIIAHALARLDIPKYISQLQSENASLKRQLEQIKTVPVFDVETGTETRAPPPKRSRDEGDSPPASGLKALKDMTDATAVDLGRVKRENEALEDRLLCTICMEADAPRAVVFGPCNHFLACASCADALQECPNCRVPITARTSIANTS